MKILALGPFFGDFKNELMTFRPFCQWLCKIIEHDEVYISTHSNRKFLYTDITDNIYCVYENLTRDELGQKGYVHDLLKVKDFQIFQKKFEKYIISKEGCDKKDIYLYNLKYLKSTPHYSIYNKIFKPVSFPKVDFEMDKDIIFIPDREHDFDEIQKVYNFLKEGGYNFIIIGDMKIHYSKMNEITKYIDYPENCYKYILNYVHKIPCVICPVGFWTFLCNLQGLPVFSWGEGISPFKDGGIYRFNNNKAVVISSSIDDVIQSLKHFLMYK